MKVDLKLKDRGLCNSSFWQIKSTGVVWDDFEKKNKKNFKIKKILEKLEVSSKKKIL